MSFKFHVSMAEEQAEPSGEKKSFDPLEPGQYKAVVMDAELKDTSKGGKQLVLQWEITGPKHEGRFIWDGHNVENANPKAVEIANENLARICKAVGVNGFDFEDGCYAIRNKPVEITIEIEAARGKYEARNRIPIGGYKAVTPTAESASPPLTTDTNRMGEPATQPPPRKIYESRESFYPQDEFQDDEPS